jgi:hypothetical protein
MGKSGRVHEIGQAFGNTSLLRYGELDFAAYKNSNKCTLFEFTHKFNTKSECFLIFVSFYEFSYCTSWIKISINTPSHVSAHDVYTNCVWKDNVLMGERT